MTHFRLTILELLLGTNYSNTELILHEHLSFQKQAILTLLKLISKLPLGASTC